MLIFSILTQPENKLRMINALVYYNYYFSFFKDKKKKSQKQPF